MGGLFKKKQEPINQKPVPASPEGQPGSKPAEGGATPPAGAIDLGPMRKSGVQLLAPKNPLLNIKGIDISHYQPKVNWDNVVKEGFQFVFAKASDGVGTKAAHFDLHRTNAEKKGLPFGAYHFMRFGGLSAKEEASNFMKASGAQRTGDLPWVVDVEWDKKNARYDEETMDDAAADEAYELACRVRDLTKRQIIIYTSYPFFKGFKSPERFFEFLLWCPAYAKGIAGPKVPLPWSDWAFWQFTDKYVNARSITGDQNLDGNWFNGTMEQLNLLRKQ